MTTKAQIKKVVDELVEAKQELARLQEDEDAPIKPAKPASATQLAALERIVRKPLPPRYRALMELHNGWQSFNGTGTILSVKYQRSAWVKDRLKAAAQDDQVQKGRRSLRQSATTTT